MISINNFVVRALKSLCGTCASSLKCIRSVYDAITGTDGTTGFAYNRWWWGEGSTSDVIWSISCGELTTCIIAI